MLQSVKNLFYQNRDGNPASHLVQLNHDEVFSEDTSEVLYILHKVYFKV
jgi:hypothetical protein